MLRSVAREGAAADLCRLPLTDVRVLDLTRLLPGAFCSMLLADLGAEIVKVEHPQGGDPLRSFGFLPGGHRETARFAVVNRNKRSITLDLARAEAAPVLEALASTADVVIEGFRPATARRFGVDAATLLARQPALVHCAITGFGQTGPYADRAGHDLNFLGISGLIALDGVMSEKTRTSGPRTFLADIGGGAYPAALGIVAALFDQARTGIGSALDISIHDGCLSWLAFPAATALAQRAESGVDPLDVSHACYGLYCAGDGRALALGALEPKFWAAFCDRIGRPDLIPLQFDAACQSEMTAEVAAVIGSRPRDEWLAMFADVDACLTPVYSVAEALDDPHAVARGIVAGNPKARYVRTPVKMARGATIRAVELPPITEAPELGADTDALLELAGIGSAERGDLRARGVI